MISRLIKLILDSMSKVVASNNLKAAAENEGQALLITKDKICGSRRKCDQDICGSGKGSSQAARSGRCIIPAGSCKRNDGSC